MNRAQRRSKAKRQQVKANTKPRYSLIQVQKAVNVAIQMRKMSKGHLFSKNLKDRCTFCGKTPKTKVECPYWFLTFLDRMQTVLINPTYFTDKEIQALWLTHGEEYQEIKLPLVFEGKDEPKKT